MLVSAPSPTAARSAVVALAVAAAPLLSCGGSGARGYRPDVPTSTTRADAPRASAPAGPTGDVQGLASRAGTPAGASPDQTGLATWYGPGFAGKRTANGERFDPRGFTAAHRKLPFGTWVEVRRVDTGRSVRVRINDRGPFGKASYVIDLAQRAAEDLDLVRLGHVRVELRIVPGP